MRRSILVILMVALLVLPAGSLGVAQESPPQPEAAASGWGSAAGPVAMERGEVEEYEPWLPPVRAGPGALITVTTTDDELNSDGDCALREAIQAANTDSAVDACVAGSGDDTVLVPSGTYTLAIPGVGENNNQTGDLDILDNLVIQGDGADTTVLDGNQLDRVLHIHQGRTVEIDDVTVTHGFLEDSSGAGIRNSGGTLTLNDVVLRENQVIRVAVNVGGGGLFNVGSYQDTTATLNNCLVTENTSAYGGGGLMNSVAGGLTSTVTLNHTTVSSNTAEFGGGIWHTWADPNSTSIMNLYNSVVEGNTTQIQGGGIAAFGWPADNVITTLTVDHSTIRGNAAAGTDTYSGRGGGLWVQGSQATLVASTVSGNTSSGNAYASGFGGGLVILGSTAEVVNSTISGNQASGSSVPNASGFGGGVAAVGQYFPATLALTNTTVAGNSSNVGGGGVVVANYGTDATITFKNSAVGDNSAPSDLGESCFTHDWGFGPGTFTSLGHNLEDYDTCEFDQPSDWINTDPILGPLQDNGGDTWTHALLAGSPAIDAGDDDACPATDQRDVARPQGPASDIGSFEVEMNITVNTCDDELNSDGDCSLREAIEAANTDAAVDACLAGSGDDWITLPPCTYTLAIPGTEEDNNQTGDLDILDTLVIYGAGADTTIVDGNQLDRVLHVHTNVVAEVNDMTVTGGLLADNNGGGIKNSSGTLTLNDVIMRGNQVLVYEGGGFQNSAYFDNATSVLNNCLVVENTAVAGGGIINGAFTGHTATLTLSNTTVISNTAELYGGGGIRQHWFTGATNAMASIALYNSLVEGNTVVSGEGGGIAIHGFPANNVTSTLTVDHSTIRGNTAYGADPYTGRAGGIAATSSTVALTASSVTGNTASGNAYASGLGGGLFILDSAAEVVNSTISENQAIGSSLPNVSGFGGGVLVAGQLAPATLTLTNTTVADNSANVGGGGIANVYFGADTVTTFKNSLVGGNSAPAGMGESCFNPDLGPGEGNLTSLGHNLEDYDYCEFDQPSDWPDADALLGPLQDNGGPTWTHALLEGSLARDHGDDAACPPTDQRGVPRPQGPVSDIGAFEAYPDENAPAVMTVSPPDGALDVAVDATVVLTFSEPISVPTFAYAVAPDPGGWAESWGSNDTVVSLTHDDFAYGTTYTATITAAEDRPGNPMAAPYAWSFSTVAEPCDPMETVTVEGPASLRVGETGVYSAAYAPITATLPVTLTWGDGTVGATAAYSWTLPGTYTLTVTATNPCGEVSGAYPVVVSSESYWIFLPLVVKDTP
jgi:CSLREA domain-containing protein